MTDCPCGSGRQYEACCGPIIDAGVPPETAEAAMRSRYTAYVRHAYPHLERTLTQGERADFSLEETQRWAEQSEWLGLSVLRVEKGGAADSEGLVEFSARFRTGGKEHEHVEAARFVREEGQWRYAGTEKIKGQTVRREAPKVGRNDPCPCGSGRKFKKCCGAAA